MMMLTLAACSWSAEPTMYKAPSSSGNEPGPVATTMTDPTPAKSQCEASTWATPAMAAGTSDNIVFGSITPDELSMAWMTKDGVVHVADRMAASDSFGPAQNIQGDFAVDRVSISSDGLRVSAISGNRRTFGQLARASRTDTFDATFDTHPFAGLNASVKERNKTGKLYDIVISADERTMVFSYTGVGDSTVRISHRASKLNDWGVGVAVSQSGLEPVNGDRRRPTGTSTDNRTIFFWDEHNGTQLMAQRAGEEATEFTSIVDIGMRPLASPNADCTMLFHAAGIDMATGGKGIASSKRM